MPRKSATADVPLPTSLDRKRIAAFRRALLRWYQHEQRHLPWRSQPPEQPPSDNPATQSWPSPVTPYHTLVSEAMLQQTQVATVIAYFLRFIGELPDVQALAAADEQQVLRLWQGLGYYRRARNLHAAAKMIVTQFDGQVPASVEQLLRLPGIGRYTAGAIASIAYDTPAPIVDGNVARVLARVLNITEPVDAPETLKQLWASAQALVPKPRKADLTVAKIPGAGALPGAGDFNQAMMELGALVCTPRNPSCSKCPLRNQCQAKVHGTINDLPNKRPKKKPQEVTHVIIAARRNGKVLFEQRPATGLWSNMWQMPTMENIASSVSRSAVNRSRNGNAYAVQTETTNEHPREDAPEHVPAPEAANVSEVAITTWFAECFGLQLGNIKVCHDFIHQTTHRTIMFVVVTAEVESGRLKPKTGQWRSLTNIDDLPLSNPQRKTVQLVRMT